MRIGLAVIAIMTAAASGLALPTLVFAQAATETPATEPVPGPTPFLFPLRLVLTGPSTATEGNVIAYRLEYQAVRQFGPGESGGLVFGWGERGAAFEGLKAISGAPPVDGGAQTVTSENIGLAGNAGVVELDVKLPAAFTGSFSAGVTIKGTDITLPNGSVVHVSTNVSPRSVTPVVPTASPSIALPGTGIAAQRRSIDQFSTLALACIALGLGMTAVGAGVLGRRY